MEAEVVLNEFLKLEPNSEEGKFRLGEVQITLLRNSGKYSINDAIQALKLTNYNTSVSSLYNILYLHYLLDSQFWIYDFKSLV